MGTDAPPPMGFTMNFGNNAYIMLEPDTRDETKLIFDLLSIGANIEQPLQEMFWVDYYGCLKEKFGVQWCSTAAINNPIPVCKLVSMLAGLHNSRGDLSFPND